MSNVELDANETIVYTPGVSPEKTLEFYKDYCHNYDKVCYTFSAKRIGENDHQSFLAFRNTWKKNYINDYRGVFQITFQPSNPISYDICTRLWCVYFMLVTLSMVVGKCDLFPHKYYGDVIMGAIVSQITSLTIVYSTVYLDADQRKHQSAASLAFVWGIHRGPVNSPHKWPVTRKMFPFDDVIMPKSFVTVTRMTRVNHTYHNHWKT